MSELKAVRNSPPPTTPWHILVDAAGYTAIVIAVLMIVLAALNTLAMCGSLSCQAWTLAYSTATPPLRGKMPPDGPTLRQGSPGYGYATLINF